MPAAKLLMSIPGIGEVTAIAVVATVNDAKHFILAANSQHGLA